MISDFNEEFEFAEDLIAKGVDTEKLLAQVSTALKIREAIRKIETQNEIDRLSRLARKQEKYVKKRLAKMREKYAYQLDLFERS